MGPADALLARGLGHQLVVGDRDPQLAQRRTRLRLRSTRSCAQAGQLVLEGALAVLDEVDEDVGAVLPEGARDLAPGDQPDPQLSARRRAGADPGQGVVIGEGHRRAPGGGRQLGDPLRGVGPVGAGGVGVQVDHGARTLPVCRPGGPLCDTGGTVARVPGLARPGCAGATE